MHRRVMSAEEYIVHHQEEVLHYLKSKFPVYHLSNFFFRDLHFGIRMMLEDQGTKLGYTESEGVARRCAEELEKSGVFTRIDQQSWVVRYPEFRTPPSKAAVQPKPAAGTRPAATAAAPPSAAVQNQQ